MAGSITDSPALLIVDGTWLSTTISSIIQDKFGSNWKDLHRIDSCLLKASVESFTPSRVTRTLVLVKKISELTEPCVFSNQDVRQLYRKCEPFHENIIEIEVMSGAYEKAFIVTGNQSFATEISQKLSSHQTKFFVSVRAFCEASFLRTSSTSPFLWLEDHLLDFVKPLLLTPPTSPRAPLAPPPGLHLNPEQQSSSNPVANAGCELAMMHDKVLALVLSFVSSSKYTSVSSRTIGRFFSSYHAQTLAILKTKLGGLKSFVRNHPELFTLTTSEDGKEFNIVLMSGSTFTKQQQLDSPCSVTHKNFDTSHESSDEESTVIDDRVNAIESMGAKLLYAALEKRLRLTQVISICDLKLYLLDYPVNNHQSSLEFIRAEFGSVTNFILRRGNVFKIFKSIDDDVVYLTLQGQ